MAIRRLSAVCPAIAAGLLALAAVACSDSLQAPPHGGGPPPERPALAADLPPQRPHGGGRRLRAPVRVEVDRHRDRVRERARARGLHGGAGLAAPGAQHHPQPRLERALPAGELQHRPEPLGDRGRVRGHGEPLPGGRRRHHRGRRDQPHDQLPEPRRRQQRHGLHEVRATRASTPRATSTRPARSTTTRAPPTCRTASCSRCRTSTPGSPRCGRRSPTT